MTVIEAVAPLEASTPKPTVVHLSGDIDIFNTAQLRQRLLNTLSHSTSSLVLDLSQVTFCGAGGLGVLLGVQARARALGITLTLAGVPPFMTRLLHITGLARHFGRPA
ncbi:STAS domain-containing protein [Nonomuraea fuscirosea]|uniref:STAS domain-containing protein n=1 Tax=Nonomuraea fuscirosea TaxID=1291556 RepID=UPI002DDC74A9|nr:STAS domain-containing protein [Nonomuraea fuscirosea]WSA52106.1 STAS domain-containing protein [Nonomuraea fuscirosea]